MALDNQTLEKVARLCKISVQDEQQDALTQQLNSILGLIDELEQINTEGVTPMAHPLGIHQPLRDDQVTHQEQREQLLANAPSVENSHILVPKVID